MMNSLLFIQIVSSLSEYVTYLELASGMHKAMKTFYPEYMLCFNKVELSLIIEMLIKD